MSCLMQGVLQMEKKLGGCLMDKPKTMLFQDGGASLCLSMEDIGPGWKSKPQADYQVHISNRYNWVTMLIIIFTYIPCILKIIKVFSPTDGQLDSLKNNFNFALKLTLQSSYMFRCENTIIREHTVWSLLKLQLLKWVKIHWCGSFGGVVA
jgi:hypothetical protein